MAAKALTQEDLDKQSERIQEKRDKIMALKAEEVANQLSVQFEGTKRLLDEEEARLDAELAVVKSRAGVANIKATAPNLEDNVAQMTEAVAAEAAAKTPTKEK